MKFIVVVMSVSAVWIFLALLLAGCGHAGESRRSRRLGVAAPGAWMWEQHDRAVRMRQEPTVPPGHPLVRTVANSEQPSASSRG